MKRKPLLLILLAALFCASPFLYPLFDSLYSGMVLNLLFVFGMIYLALPNTQAVYFNPEIRWWETDPRFIVSWPALLFRSDADPVKVRIENIAIGGAAIETFESDFTPQEEIRLEFAFEGTTYRYTATVVWWRTWNGPGNFVGLQWMKDEPNVDPEKIHALVKELKQLSTPTNKPRSRWRDFLAWLRG